MSLVTIESHHVLNFAVWLHEVYGRGDSGGDYATSRDTRSVDGRPYAGTDHVRRLAHGTGPMGTVEMMRANSVAAIIPTALGTSVGRSHPNAQRTPSAANTPARILKPISYLLRSREAW